MTLWHNIGGRIKRNFGRFHPDVDDGVIATVGQALRTGDLRAAFPGPDALAALAGFDATTLVVLGERDLFFPAGRIRPRVEQTLPSLVECLTRSDERHLLSTTVQARVTDHIREFLAGL